MEMENRFKLRISRMFRSSFGSCRPRNLSDVMEKAVFVPHNHQNFHMIEPLSPRPRPFPSICRPKPSQTPETVNHSCIIPSRDLISRAKLSEPYSPFASTKPDGRTCPPASPISPLNTFYQFGDSKFEQKKKGSERNKKKKKKKTTRMKNKHIECFPFSSSSQVTSSGGWWSSSEEDEEEEEREDETDTLFSSKSFSSDSSESQRRRSLKRSSDPYNDFRRAGTRSSEIDAMPMQGKVKDSFAVVKRSSDPYNDFRTSMVEMIVEKRIFAAKDLEHLLQCFLT
ncbi:hypothetical protein CJ030_MR0G002595 [Morella rubra]|uniref:Transcription repressor n=1 Tax=Morella rubra TaxID=262757 RepID=A0A6A1UMX6_9ROSI|nr:hypothetical protein CJ030_MR0G002595 [Morella rubra]